MQIVTLMIGAAFIYAALSLTLRRFFDWPRIGSLLLMLFSFAVIFALCWRFLTFVWSWAMGSLVDG